MGFGRAQAIRLVISAVIGLACYLIGVPDWAGLIISVLVYIAVTFSLGLYALYRQSRTTGGRQQDDWQRHPHQTGPHQTGPRPVVPPSQQRYPQPPYAPVPNPHYGGQGYTQNPYGGPYAQPQPYASGPQPAGGYDEDYAQQPPYAQQPYGPQQGTPGWPPQA